MSADEFQVIWKSYDAKLEKSMQLNLRLLKDVQSHKAKSVLGRLVAGRVFVIVLAVIYLVILCAACWYVRTQPVMAVSFGVFIVVTALATGEYIREISIIRRISYADNIVDTQRQLAGIRSSIIKIVRLSWVQLPFWSTFFISNELLRRGGQTFLLIQVPITLLLTILAVFLYRNITLANSKKKKWVKRMLGGTGIKSIGRAIDFMQEIEDFKRD